MPVKSQVIIQYLESFAPKYLAEEWDNVGLQLGAFDADVSKVLVALDFCREVLQQAQELGADMIVTHHPAMFRSIKQLRTDLPLGQLMAQAIRQNIVVYSAHTNLDAACQGVNDVLADRLEIENTEVLHVTYEEPLMKLVVFVPDGYQHQVCQALAAAGAGALGNYQACTFQSDGMGTFEPLSGANPFIGTVGKLEHVSESRIETIVPERLSKQVITAMRNAHPYEEVAFDLYPLAVKGKKYGLGRVGRLSQPQSLQDFATAVCRKLDVTHVRVVGNMDKQIGKVAVCGGSGAEFIHKACFAGADVYVTGDVKYHDAQLAQQLGLAVIDAGHFGTEYPVVPVVADLLDHAARDHGWDIKVVTSTKQADLFQTVATNTAVLPVNDPPIKAPPCPNDHEHLSDNQSKSGTIFTDGGSRGNPGHAGLGVVVYQDDQVVAEVSEYLGVTTNNVAEYRALIRGLEECRKLGICEVHVKADSELMIRQMNGQYKVKNEGLLPLYHTARQLVEQFNRVNFSHIPRSQNKQADSLANQAMDSGISGKI